MASDQNRCSLEKKLLELVEEINEYQERHDRNVEELSAIQHFLEAHRGTLPRLVVDVLESRESDNIEDQHGFPYQMERYEHQLSKLQNDMGLFKNHMVKMRWVGGRPEVYVTR